MIFQLIFSATVSDHCYSLASLCGVLLRRLAARSLMPLSCIGCCAMSASETDVWMLSMSLLSLALVWSGVHLPCGCALVSAILVFFLALQCLSVSMAILCASIEFSTPIFGKLAQAPMKRPAAAVDSLGVQVGLLLDRCTPEELDIVAETGHLPSRLKMQDLTEHR